MKKKAVYRITVDVLMTVTLLLLMPYSLIGEAFHEWVGVAMLVLFLLHHILNLAWYKNLKKGRYSPFRICQTALASLLLLTMLGSMVSGIVMSRYAFDFLPFSRGQALAQSIHLPCAYWGFVLMSLHLGLHWGVMMGTMRRVTKLQPSRTRTAVLRGLMILIVIFGTLAFIHNEIPSYLFLRTHFVFFDFDQTLVSFFLDYLTMMGLFTCVGYYVGKVLFVWGKRGR